MAEKLVNNELRESSLAEPHESQVAPPNPNLRDVMTKVETPPKKNTRESHPRTTGYREPPRPPRTTASHRELPRATENYREPPTRLVRWLGSRSLHAGSARGCVTVRQHWELPKKGL